MLETQTITYKDLENQVFHPKPPKDGDIYGICFIVTLYKKKSAVKRIMWIPEKTRSSILKNAPTAVRSDYFLKNITLERACFDDPYAILEYWGKDSSSFFCNEIGYIVYVNPYVQNFECVAIQAFNDKTPEITSELHDAIMQEISGRMSAMPQYYTNRAQLQNSIHNILSRSYTHSHNYQFMDIASCFLMQNVAGKYCLNHEHITYIQKSYQCLGMPIPSPKDMIETYFAETIYNLIVASSKRRVTYFSPNNRIDILHTLKLNTFLSNFRCVYKVMQAQLQKILDVPYQNNYLLLPYDAPLQEQMHRTQWANLMLMTHAYMFSITRSLTCSLQSLIQYNSYTPFPPAILSDSFSVYNRFTQHTVQTREDLFNTLQSGNEARDEISRLVERYRNLPWIFYETYPSQISTLFSFFENNNALNTFYDGKRIGICAFQPPTGETLSHLPFDDCSYYVMEDVYYYK